MFGGSCAWVDRENMEASLFSAAGDGNLTAVKSFLRSGSCDVNIRDESFYNFTPLHYACL